MRSLSIYLFIAALIVPSFAWACSVHDKMQYRTVAEDFCDFLDGDHHPTTDLFTPSLLHTIEQAETLNTEWEIAHPGDKPPLGDGVPYQSFPDHAPFCRPGENVHIDHQLYMEVDHIFPDTPNANWTDRLKLVKTPDGWKIDDVVYGTDYKTGLRRTLKTMFSED